MLLTWLGEVTRTVDVAASEDSHVVGEQLQGDDGEDALKDKFLANFVYLHKLTPKS